SARSLTLEPGGAAVMVALALAREGIAVGLAAAMGDDPLGRALRDRVAAASVDVRAVRLVAARTGLLFIGARDGGRELVGYRGAEADPPVAPPERARPRVVHFAALSPVPALARAQHEAARHAADRGAIVTLDVNARPRIWREAKRGVRFGI